MSTKRQRKLLGVMKMFVILLVVMVSQVFIYVKVIKEYVLIYVVLLYANYNSIKLFLKSNNRRKQLLGNICPQFYTEL